MRYIWGEPTDYPLGSRWLLHHSVRIVQNKPCRKKQRCLGYRSLPMRLVGLLSHDCTMRTKTTHTHTHIRSTHTTHDATASENLPTGGPEESGIWRGWQRWLKELKSSQPEPVPRNFEPNDVGEFNGHTDHHGPLAKKPRDWFERFRHRPTKSVDLTSLRLKKDPEREREGVTRCRGRAN